MARRSWRLQALGVLSCLVLPLLNGAQATAVEAPADTATARPTAGIARLVTTGGLSQWISCQGSGPFTLVVIPGLGAGSAQWAKVSPKLADLTRTCTYDRPGVDHSPARSDRSEGSAGAHGRELHRLLVAAGEPGPYLVLGHSYGGLIARSFAHDYPREVAGLLLMEGVDPKGSGSRLWHESGQAINMLRSRAQAAQLVHVDGPVLVLSASNPGQDHLSGPSYGDSSASIAKWRQQQESALGLSENAMQVIAHSGHVVQQDNPQAAIAAVSTLLDAAKSGTRLHCSSAWPQAHSRCAVR